MSFQKADLLRRRLAGLKFEMHDPHDPYAVLGISRDCDQAAIRKAYRDLMRRYHPDANSSAEAAQRAVEINLAYAVLGEPGKRIRFDAARTRKAERRAWEQPGKAAPAAAAAMPIAPLPAEILGGGPSQSATALGLALLMSMSMMYLVEIMMVW